MLTLLERMLTRMQIVESPWVRRMSILMQLRHAVSRELLSEFGIDGHRFRLLDNPPDAFVEFRADQYFAGFRAIAISRRAIHGISDASKPHLLRHSNKPLHDLSAVNANADVASGLPAVLPLRI
jgi:hypothetical protein